MKKLNLTPEEANKMQWHLDMIRQVFIDKQEQMECQANYVLSQSIPFLGAEPYVRDRLEHELDGKEREIASYYERLGSTHFETIDLPQMFVTRIRATRQYQRRTK